MSRDGKCHVTPKVSRDGGVESEMSAKGLAFKAKQCHVRLHRFFARELVAELGFAQLENSSEQTLEDLAFAQANLQ